MKNATQISAPVAALALGLLVTACTSLKTANPANLSRGLNAYFADHDDCLFPSALSFPYEMSKNASPKLRKQLDTLTDAGLLHREVENGIQVSRYSFTTYGSKMLTAHFCYGHRVVTAIDSFTPPATVQGQSTTRVTYSYKMMDVPGWAQSKQMLAAFPALAKSTGNQPDDSAAMVLTINGWQVPE